MTLAMVEKVPSLETLVKDIERVVSCPKPAYGECIAPRRWGKHSACFKFVSNLVVQQPSATVGLYNFSDDDYSEFINRVRMGASTHAHDEDDIRRRVIRVTQEMKEKDMPDFVIVDDVVLAPQHPAVFTSRVYGIGTPT